MSQNSGNSAGGNARGEPRKKAAMSGRIVCLDGVNVVDCTIIDTSPSGACIKVGRELKETFYLINIQQRTAHVAEVAWRKGTTYGLRFTASYPLGARLPERMSHLRQHWLDYATR